MTAVVADALWCVVLVFLGITALALAIAWYVLHEATREIDHEAVERMRTEKRRQDEWRRKVGKS